MKTVIIDSSSAILLYKCGMIQSLLKCFSVIISGAVYSELTLPGYDGSDFFYLSAPVVILKYMNQINLQFANSAALSIWGKKKL